MLGESEYLRRQNMNSKPDEEQKKKVTTSADVLVSKVYTSVSARGPHKMNALILGRVSIVTRPSPSNENALILGRVLGLDSAHPYY